MKLLFCRFISISLLVLLFAGFVFAQTESEKGIELYKQGKNKEAVAALEKASKQMKTDAEVWNYLGLAYMKGNDLKKAAKAFEKAVGLDSQKVNYQTNLAYSYFLARKFDKARIESTKAIALDAQKPDAYFVRGSTSLYEGKYDDAVKDADAAIAANPNYSLAYNLKSDALFSNFGRGIKVNLKPVENLNYLAEAKETLENCLKNCQNNSQATFQQERLEAVKTFYNYYSKRKDTNLAEPPAVPAAPNPNITPLIIITKPRAEYTDAARQAGVTGTITVLVFFAASAQVTHTIVLEGLGGGLNEKAVQAARQIVFVPAKENGKSISQIRIIQYSFSIY